jgi:hypothetical protein
MPDNIMTACHATSSNHSENMHGTTIFKFDQHQTKLIGDHFKICDVLDREIRKEGEKEEYFYTVKIHQLEAEDIVIKDVPHSHVRYVDKPYQSSAMHRGAFRHPIQIPDDIFPLAWRDLK